MTNANEVAREFHEREGVSCEIVVEHEGDQYFGRWKCDNCDATGGSSKPCDSVDDALVAAKVNFGTHCGAAHLCR